MGYKLYREIRDRAPSDWTPAERLVAWAIADDADDTTRKSWIRLPELAARTGTSTESGVRQALQRLAARGFEFRVRIATGKDGRPVFAARGRSLDYLVPAMPADRPERSPRVPERKPKSKGASRQAPSKATASDAKGDWRQSPLSSPPLLNGPSDLASRRGRAKRTTAKRTVDSVVRDVTLAAVTVFGEADTHELDPGTALALYFNHAHRVGVTDLVAYMKKIFSDGEHLDTFVANAGWCCPECLEYEENCACAALAS